MLSQNVLFLEGWAQNPEKEDGVQVQWQEVLTTLTTCLSGENSDHSETGCGRIWTEHQGSCLSIYPAEHVLNACISVNFNSLCYCACAVMSNSVPPMDCSPPGSSIHWHSPGETTGVDCLLQGIFPTQEANPGLPLQVDSLPAELPGKLTGT